ncbi:MAG: hypothetical protein IKJ43_00775 [Bacilli bacterium]|nr:hypothetical protein [Bacilli bacterium]
MTTIKEKVEVARELENLSNMIRSKISDLNYEKSQCIKMNKNTENIDAEINKLRDDLSTTWNAFEVMRNELGDEYNNRIGVEKND